VARLRIAEVLHETLQGVFSRDIGGVVIAGDGNYRSRVKQVGIVELRFIFSPLAIEVTTSPK